MRRTESFLGLGLAIAGEGAGEVPWLPVSGWRQRTGSPSCFQEFDDLIWKQVDLTFVVLAITHDDLMLSKIEIFESQISSFAQASATAVDHQLNRELLDSREAIENDFPFCLDQHCGSRACGLSTKGMEGSRQLLLQSWAIEEQQGAERLILS